MTTYQSQAVIIEAKQFTGKGVIIIGEKTTTVFTPKKGTSYLLINGIRVDIGDYIIRLDDGSYFPLRKDIFEKIFAANQEFSEIEHKRSLMNIFNQFAKKDENTTSDLQRYTKDLQEMRKELMSEFNARENITVTGDQLNEWIETINNTIRDITFLYESYHRVK